MEKQTGPRRGNEIILKSEKKFYRLIERRLKQQGFELLETLTLQGVKTIRA